MTAQPKIAVIGGGNMAGGIIGGLVKSGWSAAGFAVADPVEAARVRLREGLAVRVFADNAACISAVAGDSADAEIVVLLAVKPQSLRAVLAGIGGDLRRHRPLLISIVAGVRCADILAMVGGDLRLVRVMPNTPALVGAGMSALFATPRVDAAGRDLAQRIMAAVGETVWLPDEALLDVATAVSGSGPAYIFKMIELLAETAVEHGISRVDAERLAVQTALGAALLAKRGEEPAAALRRRVTSPGGTTEAGLRRMGELGLDEAVRGGIAAAVGRSVVLGEEFGGGDGSEATDSTD